RGIRQVYVRAAVSGGFHRTIAASIAVTSSKISVPSSLEAVARERHRCDPEQDGPGGRSARQRPPAPLRRRRGQAERAPAAPAARLFAAASPRASAPPPIHR